MTPIYDLTEWSAAQASPWIPHNAALRALEAVSRGSVLDRDLTAPPVDCEDGACYLVAATPTGAWTGKAGVMAVALGEDAVNGWLFVAVATPGQFLFVEDEAVRIQFAGAEWATANLAPEWGDIGGTLADQTDLTAAIAAASGSSGEGAPLNGIVVGLGVAYTGSLGFAMSAGSFYLDGDLVEAAAQTITLSAADATNPRIDVLYVDDNGTFGKITGTPAASPSQPAIDPLTQLYLTFVLVPATATDLNTGITTETIYDEGSEWAATTSGSGFTANSTNNPNSGTKCIEGTSVASGAYVKFVDGSPGEFGGDGSLLLSIRSKGTWNAKRSLTLQFYASGVTVGSAVTIKDGSFGFSSANTSAYQGLVISKALFSIAAGTTVDELRITGAGSGGAAIGFYIDPIKLQTTGTTTGGSSGGVTGITQEQADARYLKLSGGVLSGDLSVPAEAYGSGWNGSNEVPTKNDVYDKIEAVVAGAGSYTDEQARDAIGTALTQGTGIVVAVNDGGDTITVSADIDTDGTLAANSDAKIPSQKAVKTFVNAAVTGLLDFKGSTDCSANPNYPAASKGDAYVVSVAGKIGGASGTSVDVGDVYVASADNAGGTQASVGSSWFSLEHNAVAATAYTDAMARAAVGIAPSTQSGTSYTAVLGDAGAYIQFTNAAAVAFTIPANASVAYPIGTYIDIEQNGAGTVTLTPDTGVTLRSRGAFLATAGQYAVARVKKVATNTWTVIGDVA